MMAESPRRGLAFAMASRFDRLTAGYARRHIAAVRRRWRMLAAALIASVAGASGMAAQPRRGTAGTDPAAKSSVVALRPGAGPTSLNLVIAATTDTHGRLRGWDYYSNTPDAARGLARVGTIMDSLRLANPSRVVLVDAGDLLQGNPLTDVAQRMPSNKIHPVIAAMNVLRYDAAAIGNHEFNYGVPFLDAAIKQARFPFLAANVHEASGKLHFASTATFDRGGVRIAIVGATTPGAMVWDRDNLRAARLTVSDIVSAVKTAVQKARTNGADVVVVVVHSGFGGPSTYDTDGAALPAENVAGRIPREVSGVDVVVFGHSHSEMVDNTINGTLVLQPRNWATTVGVATLAMQKVRGKWNVVSKIGVSVPATGRVESKAVLAATEDAHRAAVAWTTTTVGKSLVAWRGDSARVQDSPIVDFVAEVMRREAKADLATTAAFSLDARISAGNVTIAQMSQLYPYENVLRSVRINGAQLRAFLEHSARFYRTLNADGSVPLNGIVDNSVAGFNYEMVTGADYVLDLRKPIGQRVTSLSVKGTPVDDADTFTMATNNYRQSGGGGYSMLASLPVVYQKDVDIRGLMIAELKRAGTIQPSDYFTQNWRIEPASAVASAYAQQNRSRVTEGAGSGEHMVPAPPGTDRITQRGSTLRLISTSDFHAALEGRTDASGRVRGGAVALQQALTKARGECKNLCTSITIDGGDLFAGSPASDWTAGVPTVAAYNRMGISAGALGNHELDFGQDTLRQRLAELNYRVLGINVVGADGKIPNWIRPDTIVVRDGWRIGVIGAASQFTPNSSKRRSVAGLTFLDPAPLVSARIKTMRAQGVDAVIVTIHDGARCTSGLSEGCGGNGINFVKALTEKPDAVVLAHAHTNMVLTINGIAAVQVTNFGRAIGVFDIPLNPRATATFGVRDVIADSASAIDPVLDTIVRNAVGRVRLRLEQFVATMKQTLDRRGEQYPLGNLIADAMRVMGSADFGAWNNGGIRTDLRAGPLNFGAVHEVVPFGNSLARMTIRGKDLPSILENFVRGSAPDSHVSGLSITYDPVKPPGRRIVSVTTADGRPLEPNKVYTLAVNDFMADDQAINKPGIVISSQILLIGDSAALAEYLGRLPQPVVAPTETRIRAVGASR